MSDQPVRRSKRQSAADYEQDDDFHFVRKSKKPKTEEPGPSVPAKKSGRGRPPSAATAAAAAARERASKEAEVDVIASAPAPAELPTTKTTATRKSARRKASIDASQEEPQLKIPKRVTRRSARLSGENAATLVEEPQTNGSSRSNGRNKEKASRQPREEAIMESPVHETSVESAKIALPMSDTPIINRNKEMRKKGGNSNRRSSLGSRGRRASSLIESGQAAIPHREVNPSEFYKHIEAEGLPEPRRMKQLLIWCGERALSAKPRHGTLNSGAVLGARAIQDQLLKDFASRSEFSNWFNRDEDVPKVPVILKPNPRNIELDEKMATLEAKIKRLKEEKKAWEVIRKSSPEDQPPLFSPDETEQIILPDFDLLDLDEETQTRLRRIQSSLEFEVDQLADNVHKLEQRVRVAGKEADKVLSLCSQRLKEREEREKKSTGTRDMPIMEVLRSLSSILPEGGG